MTALALAGLLALAPADSLDAPCPGGEVLTRADLEAAGTAHLHEALRLTSLLDGVTVDGYDAWPVAPVGVPFESGVRVVVDGAPAARGAGPEPDGLEALPVALAEVERVVVCPGPGVAGGAFGGPWIDVQTTAPAPRAYGAATYGNEAGDPGPFRYLDPSLPNVDKWGPDVEAAAVARTPSATAWLALRSRDFLPTDPAIFPRTRAATAPPRYPKRVGTILALAGRAGGLRGRLGVRWATDLPFVPEVGSEVPLDPVSAQATVSGDRQWGGVRVWGHGHAAHLRLDRPSWSALALDPSWTENRLDGALAVSATSGRPSVAAGVQAERAAAVAGAFGEAVAVGRAWVRGRFDGEAGGVGLTLAGAAAGGTVGSGGVTEAWWRPAPGVRLGAEASARRSLPEERIGLDVWAERGYDALVADGVAAALDVARLRLAATADRGPVHLTASAEGQRVRSPALGSSSTAPGAEARGTALLARVGAAWGGHGLRVRASARAQGAVDGSRAFRDAWDRLPRLGAAVDVTARPDGRLALWARLEGRGRTTWAGFADPDVPAVLLLDLGLSKRAWGDRLRLSLGGRNVLAAEERTHPLGATLAPRLFVRAEARL